MRQLAWHDLSWSLRRAPVSVLKLLKEQSGRAFIAGGYIRSCVANEPVNDIDIFSPSAEDAKKWAKIIAGDFPVFETDNAFTISKGQKYPIQFIHRWSYDKSEDLVNSFDFTIAKAVIWWGERWESLVDDDFYSDLAAKRLVYTSPVRNEDAGGSLLRLLKFYQRGYRAPLDTLGKTIARLVRAVDFERADTEEGVAKVLTGLLREVDPNVDPEHIAHLPETTEEIEL